MPAPEWHEALARLLPLVEPLGEEWIPTVDAPGRVAARDLHAPTDLPRFRRAMMDGYLCHRADLGGDGPVRLHLTGRAEPGRPAAGGPGRGEAWAITTGAPLPEQGDVVIPHERVIRRGDGIEPPDDRDAPANIAEPGEDLVRGETLLRQGERITARALAPLVAAGFTQIPVVRRPRALILTTGDELVRIDALAGDADPRARAADAGAIGTSTTNTATTDAAGRTGAAGAAPPAGQVYDVHAPLLAAELRAIGLEFVVGDPVRDEPQEARGAFARALSGNYDAIMTTGGVSVGERDYVRTTWADLGAETLLEGMRLKPGGRCFVGRAAGSKRQWLFGLSGNPAAGLAAYHLLVRPLLLRMAGCRRVVRPLQPVRLGEPYAKASPVTRALWSRVIDDEAGSMATPAGGPLLTSLARANALVLIPAGSDARPAGSTLQALRLDRPEVDPPPDVPIIAVRGASGSGKTTLIVALAAALRQRGLRVACVKHAAHGFELDKAGSDSDRLRSVGDAVLLASPAELALRLPLANREPSGESAVGLVVAAYRVVHGAPPNLVLVEGYSGEPWPYIAVGPQKAATGRSPLADPPLAVWPALTPGHPAFGGPEFAGLVERILSRIR